VLEPKAVDCSNLILTNRSVIQRLSLDKNESILSTFNYSKEFGKTVITEFEIFCDLEAYKKAPRISHYLGFLIGSLILGFASDRGGRKMILLACIWTTGTMSLFQLVGHDFISYVFFEFFIGLFIGVSNLHFAARESERVYSN
jgi:hypothetical protein